MIGETFDDVDEIDDLCRLDGRLRSDPSAAAQCPFIVEYFDSLRRTRHWMGDLTTARVVPRVVRLKLSARE